MKLYEIASEYAEAARKLADADLDPQTIEDTMAEVEGDLCDKLIAVVQVARTLDAEAKAVSEVAKAQQARAKALAARSAGLTSYALHHMQAAGLPEVKQPDILIKLRENPGSAKCVDEDLTPDLYVNEETVRTIDRSAILAALRAGIEVPGWQLDKGSRLEVR